MAAHEIWFLLAFALLALEMATGTFTMLMLGVACGVGAGIALLGFGLPLQLTAVALAGVVGTLILRRNRRSAAAAPVLPDFDLGQPVHDAVWRDDGTARVQYRGAAWEAELAAGVPDSARQGPLFIVAIRGSTLLLGPRQP